MLQVPKDLVERFGLGRSGRDEKSSDEDERDGL
jgi:hypothetical protein